MASVKDQVKSNHFDKFAKKTILVDRGGNAYKLSNLTNLPGNVISTTITFDGDTGTGNYGDYDYGTTNPFTLFNVTGLVGVRVLGYCSTTLTCASASAIKVGVDASDAALLALASAADIDTTEFWYSGGQVVVATAGDLGITKMITDDVKLEVTVANVRTGTIKFYVFWEPLSADGNVTI